MKPIAILSAAATGIVNVLYTVNASQSYDPDGSIRKWQIKWGDGAMSTGNGQPPLTIAHTYLATGTYVISLVVRDRRNAASATVTATVVIGPGSSPPPPTPVPCSYSVTPTSRTASALGESGTVNITTQDGCAWTAVSNVSWLTVRPASGSGSIFLTYDVAVNAGAQRVGVLTVAGQTVTITQDAAATPPPPPPDPPACTYSVTPDAATVPATASTGTVAVGTQVGCAWTATVDVGWVTVSSASGTSNGTFTYSVEANTGAQRVATITVQGLWIIITQAAAPAPPPPPPPTPCSYVVSPLSVALTASFSTGSIAVTVSSGCAWTAVSANPGWLTVTPPSGSGTGSINYTALANTGAARSTVIAFAGQTVTVTQQGVAPPPTPGSLLTENDLTYLGMFLLPNDPGGTRFGWSAGALAVRNVNGNSQLFITGGAQSISDPVYEINFPGVGASVASAPRASLIQAWGDIYDGKRLATPATLDIITRGLLWAQDKLWWAYGGSYNVSGAWDPSIGATVFPTSSSHVAYGPWRTQELSQKTKGYLASVPSDFANSYTAGNTISVGCPPTSGNATSPVGSWLSVLPNINVATLPPDTLGSTHYSLACQNLLAHDGSHPENRPSGSLDAWCDYTTGQIVNDPTFNNNGLRYDMLTGAAWIKTSTKEGLLMAGQITDVVAGSTNYNGYDRPHQWYGPMDQPCKHGQTATIGSGTGPKSASAVPYGFIYSRANLASAAQGVTNPGTVNASSTFKLYPKASFVNYPLVVNFTIGGLAFDAVTNRLFMTEIQADIVTNHFEPRPVVHVFAVTP